MSTRVRWGLVVGMLVAGLAAAPPPARAQGSGDGFLFHPPSATEVVRFGFDQALAGSDIFAQAISDFTLSKRDFGGFSVSGELTASLTPRWDLVFAAGWSGSSHDSEYRSWVDNAGLPIQQTTSFQRVPLTAGARYYLLPRGETIGHLAWVPRRFAPFVGAGVGAIWYRFRQYGDFIDFASDSNNVVTSDLSTSDWSLTAYGEVGVDFSLTPRIFLTGEGRYTWASGHVGPAYSGFGNVDLSGVAVTVGVGYRM